MAGGWRGNQMKRSILIVSCLCAAGLAQAQTLYNNATVLGAPYTFSFGFAIALFGAVLSIYSFLHLRRSFAIMPAVAENTSPVSVYGPECGKGIGSI